MLLFPVISSYSLPFLSECDDRRGGTNRVAGVNAGDLVPCGTTVRIKPEPLCQRPGEVVRSLYDLVYGVGASGEPTGVRVARDRYGATAVRLIGKELVDRYRIRDF